MKNVMQYKGYYGSVEYTDEDEVFFGQLLFVRALVTYEGTSVKGLRKAFEQAVNNYLDLCQEEGLTPEQPFKGSFNVRIGRELHRKIALAAAKKGLSLNKFVTEALEKVS